MINFQDFVNAHLQWRAQLSQDKHKDDFDIEVIRCDNRCEIGKWFHGPGNAQYGEVEEFSKAKDAHADFHRTVAASLVETGHAGSDSQFEVLVKALKQLSDLIFSAKSTGEEVKSPPTVIDDACLNSFRRIAAHIDNQAYELAHTLLRSLPCGDCGYHGNCNDVDSLFAKIKGKAGCQGSALLEG